MAQVNYISSAVNIAAGQGQSAEFGFVLSQFDYDTIIWISPQVPKATLEANWLVMEKQRIITKFSNNARDDALLGFNSDALVPGTMRHYGSDLQAQIGLIGAVLFTLPIPEALPASTFTLGSKSITTGALSFDPYTFEQLHQLLSELGAFTSGILAKLQMKTAAVMSVNTGDPIADTDTVNAITW